MEDVRILILDDDELRQKAFRTKFNKEKCFVDAVYTAKECIEKLNENTYDYVFLDHDLGGLTMVESGEGTGYEVAKYMRLNNIVPRRNIYVHSLNPCGRKNIVDELKYLDVEVMEAPFLWR